MSASPRTSELGGPPLRRPFVALHRANAIQALEMLARSDLEQSLPIYLDILRAFVDSPNGGLSIRVPLTNGQVAQLKQLPVRIGLVQCVRAARWEATYLHPTDPDLPEITVRSPDRPKTRRTFSIAGHGRRRYERVTIKRMKENMMATRTRKGSTRSTRSKAAEVDELEGLEELEELEDLDEVEEETPKPKRTRRTRKAKAEPEPEEDEEDEDDELVDDDEEDEEPAPKRRGRAKSTKTASRATTKTKPTSTRQPPPRRELPSGKVGPDVIADLAGVTTRDVRMYLRKNEVDKDDETGRYAFTQRQAEGHAKRIQKARA